MRISRCYQATCKGDWELVDFKPMNSNVCPVCKKGQGARRPSPRNKFFVHAPEDQAVYFSSKEQRDEYAKFIINEYYCDPSEGWNEDVEFMVVGVVDSVPIQTNVVKREDSVIDEDGYDENGSYWDSDCTHTCDYELKGLDEGISRTEEK